MPGKYSISAVALILVAFAPHAWGQPSLRTIALSGQQAPGAPSDVEFLYFSYPQLNNLGQVSFFAGLTGPGVASTNESAVFTDAGGSGPMLIARSGDPALNQPGRTYGISQEDFSLSDAGNTLIRASLSGPPSGDVAAYLSVDGATPFAYAADGMPAAGFAPGDTFADVGGTLQNDNGEIVFFGVVLLAAATEEEYGGAIFRGTPTSVPTPVAGWGEPAPGFPSDIRFADFRSFDINEPGQIAFVSRLYREGSSVDPVNNYAIFVETGGAALTPIVERREQVPSLPDGVNFYTLSLFGYNDSGTVLFESRMEGPGVTSGNDYALFVASSDSSPELIAREGDQAPGLPSGVMQVRFPNSAGNLITQLNNRGDVLFNAELSGPTVDESNDVALYLRDSEGEFSVVAREGELAPGFTAGVTYDTIYGNPSFLTAVLNDAGQAAYSVVLTDGVTNFNGIFATDLAGQSHLIAAEGELFDINDDPLVEDLRTIAYLDPSLAFNNRGQVAFSGYFTDGTAGLFVVSTVPEPSTAAMLLLGSTAIVAGYQIVRRPPPAR